MRLLILGGTWFLGKHIARRAVARGWDVTAFNRGRSGGDVPGVRSVRGDRTVPADLRRLAAHGPWECVIDTSSTDLAPREVLLATTALGPLAARWTHISTVSVYADWPHRRLTEESELLECPADADASHGHTGADGSPTVYGFQKAGGERAVAQILGERAVFLRPGVILGPGEYVGRLPWWLHRASRGGRLLAPSPAGRRIQPVDVRDVADFAVLLAERHAGPYVGGAHGAPYDGRPPGDRRIGHGSYNVTHPEGITFEGFVDACLTATGGAGRPFWAAPEALTRHGVAQWTELPLWRTHAGVWSVDSRRAVAAGLRCRPIADTVRDTWAWLQSRERPVDHPRWAEHGIDPEKEAKIIADLSG